MAPHDFFWKNWFSVAVLSASVVLWFCFCLLDELLELDCEGECALKVSCGWLVCRSGVEILELYHAGNCKVVVPIPKLYLVLLLSMHCVHFKCIGECVSR
jgi:hypothetical protein